MMKTTNVLNGGFTLIEIMIVVLIVSILSGLAVPAYSDYITRSRLIEAFDNLSQLRVRLEQYYQDNRRYTTAGGGSCGGLTMPSSDFFDYTCQNANKDQFLLRAVGKNGLSSFEYRLDQNNNKRTQSTKAGWGNPPKDNCWIGKKSGDCY